jgi:hypothetical protein
MISIHAQRKLIGCLFFWEEECVRWKLLDGEEKELLGAMEAERIAEVAGEKELAVQLEGVRRRMRLVPSSRGEGTANVGGGRAKGHEPPGYE